MPPSGSSAPPNRFERICQVVLLVVGARCAFAGHALPVEADGLAYLDVARAYLRHDWHTALNGYWGPLYSWLLAAGMRIFQPGVRSEFAVARAVNFVIFIWAVFAFSAFWRTLADWSRRNCGVCHALPDVSPSGWTSLGSLLFLVSFSWFVDVVNPDILAAAIVFMIAGLLFKLNHGQEHGIGSYVWLGTLLAAGYYAKAILLFFAGFVIAALAVQHARKKSLWRPAVAITVFLVLILPFVTTLSRTLGHFTAGDSGKLNYAWFVDGPETKTWMTAAAGGAPIPFYPGDRVSDSPRVFRLPHLPGVTYAPWYDATRFDRRSHPYFAWRGQLRQFATNLKFLHEQLLGIEGPLLVCLIVLIWCAPKAALRRLGATWFCTLPLAAIFGMYLLVHLSMRFVLGFLLVLWGAALASVVVPIELQRWGKRALLAGILVFAAYTGPGLIHYVFSSRAESTQRDIIVAEALPEYGVRPGDSVASIGDGQTAYWAHLARVSVVAEIWQVDSPQFWSGSADSQQAALHSMSESGAKAAIWRRDSSQPCPSGWLPLAQSSGCILLLP